MNDEILKILKMIEDGKLTADDGKKLIDALSDIPNAPQPVKRTAAPEKKNRILRIVIDAHGHGEDDNAKVRVNIPIEVAKKLAGLTALIPKEARREMIEQGIDIDKIDLEGLIDMFLSGQIDENLVDIDAGDSEKGANVKIYVD